MYICKLEETTSQPTLSMRITTSTTELFTDLREGYSVIKNYLAELGETPIGYPYAAYYNWEKDSLDVELGYTVKERLPEKAPIRSLEIPTGKKITLEYRGRLQKIAPAYKALNAWIEENGYEAGVNYEFYYNLLDRVPDEELMTKISYIIHSK